MSVVVCQHCGRRMNEFQPCYKSRDVTNWMILRTCRDCAQFGLSELKRLLNIVCRRLALGKETEAQARWLSKDKRRVAFVEALLSRRSAR